MELGKGLELILAEFVHVEQMIKKKGKKSSQMDKLDWESIKKKFIQRLGPDCPGYNNLKNTPAAQIRDYFTNQFNMMVPPDSNPRLRVVQDVEKMIIELRKERLEELEKAKEFLAVLKSYIDQDFKNIDSANPLNFTQTTEILKENNNLFQNDGPQNLFNATDHPIPQNSNLFEAPPMQNLFNTTENNVFAPASVESNNSALIKMQEMTGSNLLTTDYSTTGPTILSNFNCFEFYPRLPALYEIRPILNEMFSAGSDVEEVPDLNASLGFPKTAPVAPTTTIPRGPEKEKEKTKEKKHDKEKKHATKSKEQPMEVQFEPVFAVPSLPARMTQPQPQPQTMEEISNDAGMGKNFGLNIFNSVFEDTVAPSNNLFNTTEAMTTDLKEILEKISAEKHNFNPNTGFSDELAAATRTNDNANNDLFNLFNVSLSDANNNNSNNFFNLFNAAVPETTASATEQQIQNNNLFYSNLEQVLPENNNLAFNLFNTMPQTNEIIADPAKIENFSQISVPQAQIPVVQNVFDFSNPITIEKDEEQTKTVATKQIKETKIDAKEPPKIDQPSIISQLPEKNQVEESKLPQQPNVALQAHPTAKEIPQLLEKPKQSKKKHLIQKSKGAAEKSKETPKVSEKPKETPKEEEKPKEIPKEAEKSKEIPKGSEKPSDAPKEAEKTKETEKRKEIPKEAEKPKEIPKGLEKPTEAPKETEKPKEISKEEKNALLSKEKAAADIVAKMVLELEKQSKEMELEKEQEKEKPVDNIPKVPEKEQIEPLTEQEKKVVPPVFQEKIAQQKSLAKKLTIKIKNPKTKKVDVALKLETTPSSTEVLPSEPTNDEAIKTTTTTVEKMDIEPEPSKPETENTKPVEIIEPVKEAEEKKVEIKESEKPKEIEKEKEPKSEAKEEGKQKVKSVVEESPINKKKKRSRRTELESLDIAADTIIPETRKRKRIQTKEEEQLSPTPQTQQQPQDSFEPKSKKPKRNEDVDEKEPEIETEKEKAIEKEDKRMEIETEDSTTQKKDLGENKKKLKKKVENQKSLEESISEQMKEEKQKVEKDEKQKPSRLPNIPRKIIRKAPTEEEKEGMEKKKPSTPIENKEHEITKEKEPEVPIVPPSPKKPLIQSLEERLRLRELKMKEMQNKREAEGQKNDNKEKEKPKEAKVEKEKPKELNEQKEKPKEEKEKPKETKDEKEKPKEAKDEKEKPKETKGEKDKPKETKEEKEKPKETKVEKEKPKEAKDEKEKPKDEKHVRKEAEKEKEPEKPKIKEIEKKAEKDQEKPSEPKDKKKKKEEKEKPKETKESKEEKEKPKESKVEKEKSKEEKEKPKEAKDEKHVRKEAEKEKEPEKPRVKEIEKKTEKEKHKDQKMEIEKENPVIDSKQEKKPEKTEGFSKKEEKPKENGMEIEKEEPPKPKEIEKPKEAVSEIAKSSELTPKASDSSKKKTSKSSKKAPTPALSLFAIPYTRGTAKREFDFISEVEHEAASLPSSSSSSNSSSSPFTFNKDVTELMLLFLRDLRKKKIFNIFKKVVDEEQAAGYNSVIKKATALNDIIDQVTNHQITDSIQMWSQMKLMFLNCQLYNEQGNEFNAAALDARDYTRSKMQEIFQKEKEIRTKQKQEFNVKFLENSYDIGPF